MIAGRSSNHPNRRYALGDSHFLGTLYSRCCPRTAMKAGGAVALISIGAAILALGVLTLGVGLLRSPRPNWSLSFQWMRFEQHQIKCHNVVEWHRCCK